MMRNQGYSREVRYVSVLVAALAMLAVSCNLYYGKGEDKSCESRTHDDLPDIGISRPLDFGPTVKADDPVPPLSGGTLALTPDDSMVVVADADRDQVYLALLGEPDGTFPPEPPQTQLVATIALNQGDEPGRVIVDNAQRAHVALRRGGAVATIDLTNREIIGRRDVCAAPRGLAFDEQNDLVHVACYGGQLIAMKPATGEVVSSQELETGLRDVVLDSNHIYVTVFRTAEVIVLDRQARTLVERMRPPVLDTVEFDSETGEERRVVFEPGVAWRTLAGPDGGVVMLHQRARKGKIPIIQPGGYGGDGCSGGVVHGAITTLKPGQSQLPAMAMSMAVLPVDFALVANGQQSVVVASGNGDSSRIVQPPLFRVDTNQVHRPFECFFGDDSGFRRDFGQPVAVVATADDVLVVQSREPAYLSISRGEEWYVSRLDLSTTSRRDTGYDLFHLNAGGNIACASCHPTGADDARVWEFECIGPRRTQSLQFGLLGTEPFHWDGDMDDLSKLMNEVFVGRMSGGQPDKAQVDALGSWLDTLRTPPQSPPHDQSAVDRGRQVFQSPTVGCQACHSGAKFTDNRSYDVGTGGKFQVPSLTGLANRGPYIHTGCAKTLRERFTNPTCGGGDKHGVVSHLTDKELNDLIAYLETL
ncbi:MAG: c-type cytochrome [Proteobacteria bacterium]|nr:c-type cytochrome [Pseudomonadota bacterium]